MLDIIGASLAVAAPSVQLRALAVILMEVLLTIKPILVMSLPVTLFGYNFIPPIAAELVTAPGLSICKTVLVFG